MRMKTKAKSQEEIVINFFSLFSAGQKFTSLRVLRTTVRERQRRRKLFNELCLFRWKSTNFVHFLSPSFCHFHRRRRFTHFKSINEPRIREFSTSFHTQNISTKIQKKMREILKMFFRCNSLAPVVISSAVLMTFEM